MKNLPTIIQVVDRSGQNNGLYATERTDVIQIQSDVDVVCQEALELEDSQDEDWDIRTYIDEKLEDSYGLVRVYAADQVLMDIF